MRYVALLRGINVGGKNRVPMPDLKTCFEDLGHQNVVTYINSGNIIFDSPETDAVKLVEDCERAIEERFGFHVVCSVISSTDLERSLAHAPDWWGADKSAKHNAIFVIPPATVETIMRAVGEAKPEYERVAAYSPIIFWSAPTATFSRTRYSKIVGTDAYRSITVRNANTAKKLLDLCRDTM